VSHPLECRGLTPLLRWTSHHEAIRWFRSVRRHRTLCCYCTLLLLAALLLVSVEPASATIQYSVSLAHPEQHLFHVTMTILNVHATVTVQMPAWNALYQTRDFSHHVQQIEAFAGGEPAPVEKIDKQTWRITGDGTVTIRYATYWDDAGPFASQLNAEHAFINPATILMYVPDRRSEAVTLSMPDVPFDWGLQSSALTSLDQLSRARNFVLESYNYDGLADAPIEAAKFQQFDLPGISPRVSVVVHGEGWNKKRIEEDLAKICKYELKLMGGAPFEHYTFLLHIGRGYGAGGMEHANSTAIGIESGEYLDGVAAHEFFHLWNVKRIRPASLEPVDYSKEQYTRALWFAEGVTNTYASYTLLRTKLWTKQQFYDDLAQQIFELEARPANRWQSAEQSSLDAWLEKYPLYNRPEHSVSYYTKGQVLGVLFDLQIRGRTRDSQGGAKSLDDVLRLLNEEFARAGKPYCDSLDIRLAAEKVAGGSFADFFDRYVSRAEPLPYADTLAIVGLELKTLERRRPTLEFAAQRDSDGNLVVHGVDEDSTAAAAGLRAGDVIVLWNKQEPPRRLERWLREQEPGDVLRLAVRRDAKQIDLEFHLGEAKDVFYEIVEDGHAPDKAKRVRDAWLRGD
jgi:predicted metalloprotease with PDZ domain